MKIGEKLKQVRLFQGKSQKKMMTDYFDRSFYSRVENNKTNVTAEDLIKILQGNNISVVDFFSDYGDVQPKNRVYQDKIEYAYAAKDINQLKIIQRDAEFTNRIVKKVVELMIAKLENKSEKYANLRAFFKRYIYDLDKWDEDSLWVFTYSIFIYNINDLTGIIDSIFNKYQEIEFIDNKTIKLLAKISVDYLDICLNHKNIKRQIDKTLDFIDDLPYIEEITLYKIYGVYYRSMYNKEKQNCDDILDILDECGYANQVMKLRNKIQM